MSARSTQWPSLLTRQHKPPPHDYSPQGETLAGSGAKHRPRSWSRPTQWFWVSTRTRTYKVALVLYQKLILHNVLSLDLHNALGLDLHNVLGLDLHNVLGLDLHNVQGLDLDNFLV